jgi:hypothetical protein
MNFGGAQVAQRSGCGAEVAQRDAHATRELL